jgi:hypothetical protein
LKRLVFFLMGIIVCLIVAGIVLAIPGYDDRGVVNDPNVNERANACYEGSSLEGKCDTQVMWDAGWYLIRYQYGLLGRGDIPEIYHWILPVEATPDGGGQIGPVLPTNTPLPL